MRARFYHPRAMRFLNQDPIGFAEGMNWFAAFDNNPVGKVDPSGLWADFNIPAGWASEAAMVKHEVENGLAPGSLPRSGGHNPGADYVKYWALVTPVVASAPLGGVGAIRVAPAVPMVATQLNTAQLYGQAALLSRAPQLYTVGAAATGFIGAASSTPPSAITASDKYVVAAQLGGYMYSYQDEISNLKDGAYNVSKIILTNIRDGFNKPNGPWDFGNAPPSYGLRGSVILNVPNPSMQSSQLSNNDKKNK